MPTATPFTFFGNQTLVSGVPSLSAGVLFSGFPFFLDKVDVSGFDYWVTLGNTQKGSTPTQSEIDLSWDNAIKLYWNLYAINGVGIEASTQLYDQINTVDEGSIPEPYLRDTRTGGYDFGTGTDVSGFLADIEPVRMYNGVTTDEDNFLGYGLKPSASILDFSIILTVDAGGSVAVYLFSYGDARTGGALNDVAYTTISDIPITAQAFVSIDGGSGTADAATLTADNSVGDSTQLTSLEFYTY